MGPIILEHFRWGPESRVFDGEDDDSGRFEQSGEELSEIVQTVLSQYLPFNDTLTASLIDQDPADIRDGGEPFMSSDGLYVESRVDLAEHFARWRQVQDELQHKRRYFSEKAKDFFSWIFDGIEHLIGPREPKSDLDGVVRTLDVGHALFRARACSSASILKSVVDDPESQLGAPPPEAAQAGRMNAHGVPVFYGSFDSATCIAELRAPLGGRVAVGRFILTRSVRLLDFRRLESVRHSGKPLSFFDPEFTQKVEQRKFTARLHELIREHVLPGQESQYLITQAMAEYLAHVRTPAFDGLIFGSAQHQDGANVVLFPADFGPKPPSAELLAEDFGDKPIPRSTVTATKLLRFEQGSLKLHEIVNIEYRSTEMLFMIAPDGSVVDYDPDAEWDDD